MIMINKKEQLENTYAIGNDTKYYQELAFGLGVGFEPDGYDTRFRDCTGLVIRDYGEGLELSTFNGSKPSGGNEMRMVIKPKCTKVSYEKCDYHSSLGGFDIYYEASPLEFVKIVSIQELLSKAKNNFLYRRIETEITERQEFIEVFNSYASTNGFICTSEFAGHIYDSGKFKLIEQDGE